MDHILSIVLFTPIVGMLILLLIPASKPGAVKIWAHAASFAGFLVSLLPADYATPYRVLNALPAMLRGEYNMGAVTRLVGWSALLSCVSASLSMGYFARRDV